MQTKRTPATILLIFHTLLLCWGDENSIPSGIILPDDNVRILSNDVEDELSFLIGHKREHFQQQTGKPKSRLSGGWGYFPASGSCNQYIHCDKDGSAYLETCAVGTFFNGRKCVRAEDVECVFDPCRRLGNGRHYSDGQTCYGFYKCLNGQSIQGVCPHGSAFNSLTQSCLLDDTCIQTFDLKHSCSAGTTMPVPGQPHMFYLWDGRDGVTEMTCPRGLWYNPHVCTCDWVTPGVALYNKHGCVPMFHFGYNGDFLEAYNKVPQSPNTAVSLYKKSALFDKGGQIVIWMMNDIDMDSEWALCFEFLTQSRDGEVALLSNDWQGLPFTYKITHVPVKHIIVGYFRMKDGTVVELVITGVAARIPHFLRLAKYGDLLKMRVDNMPAAAVNIAAGIASAPSPLVIGAAKDCDGFQGFFDELKFFRCVPDGFFGDY